MLGTMFWGFSLRPAALPFSWEAKVQLRSLRAACRRSGSALFYLPPPTLPHDVGTGALTFEQYKIVEELEIQKWTKPDDKCRTKVRLIRALLEEQLKAEGAFKGRRFVLTIAGAGDCVFLAGATVLLVQAWQRHNLVQQLQRCAPFPALRLAHWVMRGLALCWIYQATPCSAPP